MFRCLLHFLLLQYVMMADIILPSTSDKNSYGPYRLTVIRMISCNDEMSEQSSFSHSRGGVSELNMTLNHNMMSATLTMFKTCDLAKSKSKTTISFKKDGVKKIFLSYGDKNTCQHFALGTALKTVLRLKDCFIRKGVYKLNVNMTENTLLFTGPSFFYGEFEYKTWVRCKTELLFCMICSVLYEKKI